MAKFYTDNFEKQWVNKPAQPFNKGEVAGRVRLLMGRLTVPTTLDADDLIDVGYIPANSVIIDAKIIISKSLGATGILELGHGASETEALEGSQADISADSNGLVSDADAGGQGVLARATLDSAILGKRLGAETLIQAKCTESVDGNVDDAVAYFIVEYVND